MEMVAASAVAGPVASDLYAKLKGRDIPLEIEILKAIHEELCRIGRSEDRRTHLDVGATLSPGGRVLIVYPEGYNHVSVFVYGTAVVNILIQRDGKQDLAVALPQNRFTAIEVPDGSYLSLATGGNPQQDVTLRYSDEQWGTVLP